MREIQTAAAIADHPWLGRFQSELERADLAPATVEGYLKDIRADRNLSRPITLREIRYRTIPHACPFRPKLIGREDLIGDERYATPDARMQREAEVDAIVTGWTRERTKQEAMAQLSAVGVPAGAVLDTQELIDEPSFYERGILQEMTHGERRMVMPTWPVRFDGVPTKVESAPLLGEHTTEVLSDWLGLDAAAVGKLREDGIV